MIDVERQLNYWRQSSSEDWEVAQELVANGRARHGLFLTLSKEQKLFLARFDQYQIEGRYPEMLPKAPTREKAAQEIAVAQEFISWLKQKLQKL